MDTDPVDESDEEVSNVHDHYPYFGDGSGRSEPRTIRSIRIREDEENDSSAMSSPMAKVGRKKGFFSQPQGTMEYIVASKDTLDAIALTFDATTSQLMRLNHLTSRMIFPGQKVYVPDPDAPEPIVLSPTNKNFLSDTPAAFQTMSTSRGDIPTISQNSRKADIPIISQSTSNSKKNRSSFLRKSWSKDEEGSRRWSKKSGKKPVRKQLSTPVPGRVIRQESDEAEIDDVNSKQFLKINVKYITDGEGVVSGVMLVTPNAIMFDPNVSDPLVRERGTTPYGVITQMDKVLGASMYHDISAMNLKAQPGAQQSSSSLYIPGQEDENKTEEAANNKQSSTDPSLSEKQTNGLGPSPNDKNSLHDDDEEKLKQGQVAEDHSNADQFVDSSTRTDVDEDSSSNVTNNGCDTQLSTKSNSTFLPSNSDSPTRTDKTTLYNILESGQSSKDSDEVDSVNGNSNNTRVVLNDLNQTSSDVEMSDAKENVQSSESNAKLKRNVFQNQKLTKTELSSPVLSDEESESRIKCFKGEEDSSEEETNTSVEYERLEDDFPGGRNSERLETAQEPGLSPNQHLASASSESPTLEKQDSETLEKEMDIQVDSPSTTPLVGDDNDDEGQSFVNYSLGMFVNDERKCSLVADMTECVTNNSFIEQELKEIEQGGNELRRLSDEELLKELSWDSDKVIEEKLGEQSLEKKEEMVKEEMVKEEMVKEEMVKEEMVKEEMVKEEMVKDEMVKDETVKEETVKTRTSDSKVKLVYAHANFDEFRPKPAQRYDDPPLYLCLKVYRPMQRTFAPRPSSGEEDSTIKAKVPEYWFAIPQEKAENLYNFFLQWSPEVYGKEVNPDDLGFVPVDKDEGELEIVEDFFLEPISKDWEIVSKEEANRRRMTILECEMNLPLPELQGESKLLEPEHIIKLRKELPARTEGYMWSLIYGTGSHGYSLQSLYRTMRGWDTPVLLVVKDKENYLFGALVSCPIRMSDSYYGTGESFLFQFESGVDLTIFRWTGENNYFIKGDRDSISIGGGGGTHGLWFDGDLYHGRCRKCKTFDNKILSGSEDFVIKNLEVWGFVM